MTPALVVIAKAPVAGRSKTRLTPPCSPHEAALLARAALQDTLDAVAATPVARRVCVLEGEPGDWLPEGFEVIQQRGDGLDERLAHAFAAVGEPAVLIGMDTPQVTPELLGAGLGALECFESVFGAALDGGYWGIGLREPDDAVFAGVPMSATHTGAVQRARLAVLGHRTAVLPPLLDVDTFADARLVAAEAPDGAFAHALATMALAEMAA
jgi:uncharacterized protein